MSALDRAAWHEAAPIRVSPSRGGAVRVVLGIDVNPGPDGTYRDLRIVDSVNTEVPYVLDYEPDEPEALASAPVAVRESATGDEQRFILDAGTANAAVGAIDVTTSTVAFRREVTVAFSNDGAVWRIAGEGSLERFSGMAPARVRFHEQNARFWRLDIANGDDARLAEPRFTLRGTRHTIVFPAIPLERYTALSGNPKAAAPVYDLGVLFARRPSAIVANGATDGNRGTTPSRRPPPWVRHDISLDAAFLTAAILVGVIATRAFRSGAEQR